jgi:hypothetical protein
MGWNLEDCLARTFSMREGTCHRANTTDVRLGKEPSRPTLAAVPSLHSPPRVRDIAVRVRTEDVVTQKCPFDLHREDYGHRSFWAYKHVSVVQERQHAHLLGKDAEVLLQHRVLKSRYYGQAA